MQNKDLTQLKKEDIEAIKNQIKNARENRTGLTQILNKKYLEENKFVLFSVVTKNKDRLEVISERTSIGYLISNNVVYDFISDEVYNVYTLFKNDNKNKKGNYAYICNLLFPKSKKKIHSTIKNVEKLEEIFEKYIMEYEANKLQFSLNMEQLKNEEHIPYIPKKKIN